MCVKGVVVPCNYSAPRHQLESWRVLIFELLRENIERVLRVGRGGERPHAQRRVSGSVLERAESKIGERRNLVAVDDVESGARSRGPHALQHVDEALRDAENEHEVVDFGRLDAHRRHR